MKRLAYGLLVAILLILLLTQWHDRSTRLSPEENRVNELPVSEVSADALTVKAGERFTLSLQSNPTTGYHWELADSLDGTRLRLAGNEYQPDRTTGLVGSGGTEHWTFEALRPGKTAVRFKYVRPWEKDKAPVEEKSFEIVIQK